MDARGKFGEQERCVRVARGDSASSLIFTEVDLKMQNVRPIKLVAGMS